MITGVFVATLFSLAQDVDFKASVKRQVQVGERFQLTYQVNAQGSQFRGPDFSGFRVISGPSSFSSHSTQIINNKVTQSVTLSYTYYLQSTEEGTFTLPPAGITVDGKKYESNAVTIKVVPAKASTNPNQGNQSQSTRPNQSTTRQQQTSGNSLTEDDLYIKATTSNLNPYQGEQIIVTYKIYTKVPVTPQSISNYPSFQGFWSKNLMDENEISPAKTEYIDGQEYITAEIRKVALFAQKNGKLTIDPMELDCVVQMRKQTRQRRNNDPFDWFFDDPFFNRNVQNLELTLKSNPLIINVKPLPLANKPANFTGAVGTFSIKSTVDKTELTANDALTYKVIITGKGNLDLIDKIKTTFPPDFEVYDPKVTSRISATANGVSGSKAFEYLIIPRNAGDFEIEPLEFPYFDISTNKYVTRTAPGYPIKVEKGEGTYSNVAYSGVSQEDVQYIGSDIRHIMTGPLSLNTINTYFFNSLPFYLLILIPLLVAIILIILLKSRQKKRQDHALMMNKKATKVARKNLKKAHHFLKTEKKDEFFIEISLALWGYLGNKFNIPKASLSMDTVHQTLAGKNIDKELIDQFIETLNNTEYARFAPGDSSSQMNQIYDEALEIVSKIERELR